MPIFLDRIDSAPLQDENFSFSFYSWVSILVDTLNESIDTIQNSFNLLGAPAFTQAQILAMQADVPTPLFDGIFLYCTDHLPDPVYVGRINGALVQFTTTPFP